ncbi:hypothetical protein GCM10023205_62250 [Yinghuangia aomiensis]|uniref:SGNH hydrolase-type esterase domain-containing protein n=1 Tax=Yinghuangia aomiensis TaxID=676205 RepID=A0ABP9I0F0_9ACTN
MIPEQLKQRMLAGMNAQMTMRATQFEQLPPPPGQVVFFGDSITEGGLWHEWFPGLPLVNRGIGGNTVDDLIARVDTAIADPAAVFVLVGTNDLDTSSVMELVFPRGPLLTVDEIAARMRILVAAIRERAPQAPLFVQSVMPRQAELAEMLGKLNTHYRHIAQGSGATYLDLWPALADESGGLRPDYTLDNLHLTGLGYAAWVEVLAPHVAALDLARPSDSIRH